VTPLDRIEWGVGVGGDGRLTETCLRIALVIQGIDANYDATASGDTARLANQGIAGGSASGDLARTNLSNYIGSWQKAVASATNQTNSLQYRLNKQRLQQLSALQDGSVANPNWQSDQQDLTNQLNTAKSNLVPNTLGSELTTAGEVAGKGIAASNSVTATGDTSDAGAAAAAGASLPQSKSSTTGQ